MRVRAHEHAVADPRGPAGPAADERVLHHYAVAPEGDLAGLVLRGHDGAEQDTSALAYRDVARYDRVRRHPGALVDPRPLPGVLDKHGEELI